MAEIIKTYSKDKRTPIEQIYSSFSMLKENKWKKQIVFMQSFEHEGKKISLPILSFRTLKKGKALWIIGGIHGEEPAGVMAISKKINLLNKLAKTIPLVVLPLCNPKGYMLNWRYINVKKYSKRKSFQSVGDSEHYLLDEDEWKKPRRKVPVCEESKNLSDYCLKVSKTHKPLLVLDLHEDFSSSNTYIYSQGILGADDPIAKEIVKILKRKKIKIAKAGKTIFNQNINEGIVANIKDGSIEELLASKKIYVDGRIKKGPSAKSVIVVETRSIRSPLKKRVQAHSSILRNSRRFMDLARKIPASKEDGGII